MVADTTAVVITGMHRSGTSLAASLLGRCGVDLGTNLLGAGPGNPRGHFEDTEILRIHDDFLRERCGTSYPVEAPGPPPVGVVEALRDLVAIRTGLWGFKDPRTCHLLPTWESLLPDARFVFVVRHPLEVVASLLRRGTDPELVASPVTALEAWGCAHRAILAHLALRTTSSVVVPISALVRDAAGTLRSLAASLGVPLRPTALDLVEPNEIRRFDSRRADRWLDVVSPSSATIWAAIRERVPSELGEDGDPEVGATGSGNRPEPEVWTTARPSISLQFALADLSPITVERHEATLREFGRRVSILHRDMTLIERDRDRVADENTDLRARLEERTRELEEVRRVVDRQARSEELALSERSRAGRDGNEP